MALWVHNGPVPTSTDTDVVSFYDSQPQPPGRSFLIYQSIASHTPLSNLGYDWSRIVAVEVDEPYGPQADPKIDSIIKYPDNSPACQGDPSPYIGPIDAALAQKAAELKALAPKARFWVNLTQAEANWIGFCRPPPQVFNRAYIDVISADWYYVGFSTLRPFYDVLVANPAKPDQQLALVPGTFYRSDSYNPSAQASLLQGYFDYANNMNQSCNLPLGERGVTGSYDGCRVWMVMGWFTGLHTDGNVTYIGELNPSAAPITAVWRQELALPLRADLAHQLTPAQLLQPILDQLLLGD